MKELNGDHEFSIVIITEDDSVSVIFPGLPEEICGGGYTEDEATADAVNALGKYLIDLEADGGEIPDPPKCEFKTLAISFMDLEEGETDVR